MCTLLLTRINITTCYNKCNLIILCSVRAYLKLLFSKNSKSCALSQSSMLSDRLYLKLTISIKRKKLTNSLSKYSNY